MGKVDASSRKMASKGEDETIVTEMDEKKQLTSMALLVSQTSTCYLTCTWEGNEKE
jgi:hypothetical protein